MFKIGNTASWCCLVLTAEATHLRFILAPRKMSLMLASFEDMDLFYGKLYKTSISLHWENRQFSVPFGTFERD